VCGIVREVCNELWEVLQPEFVKMPSNVEEWLGVSRQYEQIWNFPKCVGAMENTL
jgi:hypothetical protein